MAADDFDAPELYFNRELSLLEFNRRVLAQTLDDSVPLLERLKFLFITSSNLDEFFEIRVANLKRQMAFNANKRYPDGATVEEVLHHISVTCHELVKEKYRIFNEVLLPKLTQESIFFLNRELWTSGQRGWLRTYFHEEIQPIITPIGLDLAHPFPRLINKSLNFIFALEGKDAFGRDSGLAIVHAPRSLPRFIRLPETLCASKDTFVFLSSIIHAFADELFPGMNILGCYQFRLTRDSDVLLDEEMIEDLPRALKGQLFQRRFGEAVRLEAVENCPQEILNFLLKKFNLDIQQLYLVDGPVNLNRLMTVTDMIEKPHLKYPTFTPALPKFFKSSDADIFEILKEYGDILLHHPYQSFTPVLEFILQAARDPHVLAIKQTLYRTGQDPSIVNALIEAARNGKEVTAVVELRARFDEEDNMTLANQLQEAGVLVVYGVLGYKTHAKLTLVARRENGTLKRYAHLGTGNYHVQNATLYCDFGLITEDKAITEDVYYVFQQLTGMGKTTKLKKLMLAPFGLNKGLLALIRQEIENAKQGLPAQITAKMNALTDVRLIQAFYKASCAGVKIDLIVRGMCCLRPGIPGVSEHIRVYSIIGRFLEHARAYYFHNNGDPKLFLASADGMERNLHHRVEVGFPIEMMPLALRIRKEAFDLAVADPTAWLLQKDGSYEKQKATASVTLGVQEALLSKFNLKS